MERQQPDAGRMKDWLLRIYLSVSCLILLSKVNSYRADKGDRILRALFFVACTAERENVMECVRVGIIMEKKHYHKKCDIKIEKCRLKRQSNVRKLTCN